jgi:hypothetical protein
MPPLAKWLSPIQRPSRGPQRPCGELRPSGPSAAVNEFPSEAHAPSGGLLHGRLQNPAKAPACCCSTSVSTEGPPTHALISTARARAQGTRSGKAIGRPKVPAEETAAIRAALGGLAIRKVARMVWRWKLHGAAGRARDAGLIDHGVGAQTAVVGMQVPSTYRNRLA